MFITIYYSVTCLLNTRTQLHTLFMWMMLKLIVRILVCSVIFVPSFRCQISCALSKVISCQCCFVKSEDLALHSDNLDDYKERPKMFIRFTLFNSYFCQLFTSS